LWEIEVADKLLKTVKALTVQA